MFSCVFFTFYTVSSCIFSRPTRGRGVPFRYSVFLFLLQAPLEKEEYLAWQQDLEADDKGLTVDRPTVFRWTGDGKEVFLSGSFNNWTNKIPLIRR